MKTICPAFCKLLFAAGLALPFAAHAAPPGAGELLQQIKPALPPLPSPSETGLKIEGGEGGKAQPSTPFLVKKIEIAGNTLFDTSTLHALVADAEGKQLTLTQLTELAGRITDYYHRHGYPLTRAIIPAQTIVNGVVTIEVIEAKYGSIFINNGSRVDNSILGATLSSLKAGEPIEQAAMEHALLLLSDIPGVSSDPTLKPGEKTGTSDLVIIAKPTPFFYGNAALDNYGNRYTGKTKLTAGANYSNPFHHGDVLGFTGMSSGSGMNYGKIGYDTLLNGAGTHAGASYSMLHYILGDTLSNLNGHGTANVGDLWIKHPITRSRDSSLYGQLQFEHSSLADHVDASGTKTDRHLDIWTGTLSGDNHMMGGTNTYSFDLTSGNVGFDDAAAQAADAATAKTQGNFTKWNASFSRLQSAGEKSAWYVALSGQWANTNLDSSQKMTAGGPYTVRAYDMGAVSGDRGYLGTLEWRYGLSQAWQAVTFLDSEYVVVNRSPWVAGANTASLSGAGIGFNWADNGWSAKAYVATKINSSPVLAAASSSSRAWIQIGKGF